MAGGLTLTGIVLKSAPSGERDRHIVLLTRERGKISAFARGARRQDSPLLGACQPFAFGSFQVFEGRSSYTVTGADISNYFPELREDLEKVCYGAYFCEVANYFTRENLPAVEMMKLLYQSLRALAKDTIPDPLVRAVYELRMIQLNGEAPQVFQCVGCGKEGNLSYFSSRAGGLLCPDCRSMDPRKGIELEGAVIYAMQFILTAPLEKLYTFVLKDEIQVELIRVMADYYDRYVDGEFKSLELLSLNP